MLELKGITKDYQAGDTVVHALKGINLQFRKSEFVSILGQSGCGKTTTLNIIGGLDQYTSGDLVINGRSTKDFKDRDWDTYRNHSVGFVFQSYNLIPHQTVLQNVELALTLSGVPKSERRERAAKALGEVGLASQLNKRPSEMSGGQLQRVAIARALVNNPDIILADEPTGALDSETSVQVMDILKEISKDRLVVMVTHNPELADRYSTRIVRMLDGNVISDSNPLTEDEYKAELAAAEEFSKEEAGKKRPSMNFVTSFGLSLKNLFTKKGRTVLTSFAGSIGIIGIALIYAVSQGMTMYIDAVQQDTLSTYPLSIMSETADMTAMLSAFGSAMEDVENQPENSVREQQFMSQVFAKIGTNDLRAFKEHMDENMSEIEGYLNAVQYSYGISPQVYTIDVAGNVVQVNPSTLMAGLMGSAMGTTTASSSSSGMSSMYSSGVFTEMIDNRELLQSQYDVLAGAWPEKYNEVLLVLGAEDSITDYMAYALGLLDQRELKDMMMTVMNGDEVEEPGEADIWTYDDLLNVNLTLVQPADEYRYNSQYGVWEDMSDDEDYMRSLVENGEKLKVTGIVCAKPGVAASAMAPGIAYLPELTEYVISKAADSEIVKSQMADENVDVFSGKTFDELLSDESEGMDFNNMISVDSDMLSSAFSVDIDPNEIRDLISDYMESILGSENMDTAAAEADFMSTLKTLCGGMIRSYVLANGDSLTNTAVIETEQVQPAVDEYFASASAQGIIESINAKYPISAESYSETYSKLVSSVLGAYVYASGGQAPLNDEIAKTITDSLDSNTAILAVAKAAAGPMTAAASQGAAQDAFDKASAAITQMLSSAFKVDGSKIASAFRFNMTEEELMRLMQTMSSPQEERNAERNLKKLGYADTDQPEAISIYLKDFTAKEEFIDFIESYNSDVQNRGEEELVISYTDMTGILMSSIKTVVDSITYVLIAFVAISLVVSSIMIGVITLISVQERTKEIGILRAIGASKKNVSGMFNAETMIIGFTSGLLGVVITYVLCIPINIILHRLTGISNLSAYLPPAVGLVLILISIALTLISGIIPSRSAAKKDPVVALRTE